MIFVGNLLEILVNPNRTGGKIAAKRFADLSKEWHDKVIQTFNDIPIAENDIDMELEKLKTPSATWTYILNDNPLDFVLGVVGEDIGLSAAMGITAPIIKIIRKIKNRSACVE